MKERFHSSRGWDTIVVYALILLPASYAVRYLRLEEPYPTVVTVVGIVLAEVIYRAYRKVKPSSGD